MKNILNYWPFDYEPRKIQKTALKWLEENQDKKYLIIEAPVGSGKSNIGITLSQYLSDKQFGNSFILTPQRILQEQYEKSFGPNNLVQLASLYGKANYTCNTKNTNCEIGSMLKPSCNKCPHLAAKMHAKRAGDVVMNYKLALLTFGFAQTFKKRRLMILDECHQLEDHLVEFDAITVTEKKAKKFNVNWKVKSKFNDACAWIRDYYKPALEKYLIKQGEIIEPLLDKAGTDLTYDDVNKLQDYNKVQDHNDEISWFITQHEKVNLEKDFVLVHDKHSMKFKRLTGEYSFKRIVEPMADKFLFMSSTVLNKEGFCKDLGINPKETAFVSLGSEFTPSNRPVFFMPTARMNSKWQTDENKKGREAMLNKIQQICEMHEGDSGIIHTGNFAIAEWLVNNLNVDQEIFHHNPSSGDDRNAVINAFIAHPKPGLLISPSITEGLDLREDLSHFAIFAKVPYGYLGDQWIKRRMQMSNEWYQRRALIDIIQGGGRVVRDKTDWGNVYILDMSWQMLYRINGNMVPQWWKDAYRVVD